MAELKARGCCIEGCDRPFHAKEMCSAHYTRQWRFGDPLAGGAFKPFGASPEGVAVVEKRNELFTHNDVDRIPC